MSTPLFFISFERKVLALVLFFPEKVFFLVSFPEALECLYWIIYPHHRVHKQHCTVIPLSLIDLQTVIGKSGSVVVSECWVLDGCPETQLSLSFHSLHLFLFSSSLIFSYFMHLPTNAILQISASSTFAPCPSPFLSSHIISPAFSL